ncbi:hypothetical protein GCM10028803_03750 [Larkinella knui]|uniref:TlpA family protein disulfide reductase n=1 Tax=Larkinella knui TaxID=2025310 RepID=A0A3P1CKV4_9BACT|nr:TlpA disulfide reductase family protein [Larkinella knui]RRB13937.1 TlpA family protein disulfide reductase [Larkinella knui]
MKVNVVFGLLILSLVISSCDQKKDSAEPVMAPAVILKDITSFLAYRQQNVKLDEDFLALDTVSNRLDRGSFLKLIATGNYFPLRLKSKDSTAIYQLATLTPSTNQDIRITVKYWGLEEWEHYQKEGTPLPDYTFTDLDGKRYTKTTTKGKILVLKCWFLACLPCIQEIPVLNDLKQRYKDRDDILFVSLCFDSPEKVAAFLKKKKFDYAVVPNQQKFLEDTLQVNSYPTHFVINRQGLIARKVNSYPGLAYALAKEARR